MARLGRAADRCQAGARPGRVRVPDVARRRRATRRQACPRRTPAAHLRPVRGALVRLFAAPPAGEPEDRRLHRRGHARAAGAAPQRLRLIWAEAEGCRVVDAVEIALRTALLATGKPGILAFEGAYHGTGLLALAATSIDAFRLPFRTWLPGPVYRRRFGEDPGPLPARCGCVIVEPVQGRG